jgi:hypothetical protein
MDEIWDDEGTMLWTGYLAGEIHRQEPLRFKSSGKTYYLLSRMHVFSDGGDHHYHIVVTANVSCHQQDGAPPSLREVILAQRREELHQ